MTGKCNVQSKMVFRNGLLLAPKTITNLIENGLRLYEQGPPNGNFEVAWRLYTTMAAVGKERRYRCFQDCNEVFDTTVS